MTAIQEAALEVLRARYRQEYDLSPRSPIFEVDDERLRETAQQVAAAVLPSVAEEVRKAKAEALRKMQEHHEREADKAQTLAVRGIHLTIAGSARKHATEYETRSADERR